MRSGLGYGWRQARRCWQSRPPPQAFAIAHNNLTMAGGDFTDLDMAGIWERETYAAMLADLAAQGETPITVDESALDALLAALRAPDGPIDPAELWQGMPEFEQQDQAWKTLTVYFTCQEDYNAFQAAIGQQLTRKTTFTWYPKQAAVAIKEYICE